MANRDELYREFGPLLLEAIVLIMLDEINELRTNIGLSPRTKQQVLNTLDTKLDGLTNYTWLD